MVATAEVFTSIFILLIGFVSMYLYFKRKAIMWPIISFVIFSAMTIYAPSIPFTIDLSGATIPSGANVLMTGVSMLFALINLLLSINVAFELFGKKKIETM